MFYLGIFCHQMNHQCQEQLVSSLVVGQKDLMEAPKQLKLLPRLLFASHKLMLRSYRCGQHLTVSLKVEKQS